MNRRNATLVIIGLALTTWAATSAGQTPPPAPSPSQKRDADAERRDAESAPVATEAQGFTPQERDPTVPGAKLKGIIGGAKNAPPSAVTAKAGTLVLRGRVLAKGKPPAAMVEVDGKIYSVGKGSPFAGGVYRVLDIDSLEIRMEFVPSREIVILR